MGDKETLDPEGFANAIDEGLSKKVDYTILDALIGSVARKNNEVMKLAFGISENRVCQNILWHLSKSGPKTSKDLALATKISKSALSGAVKELLELGIIVKKSGSYGSEPLHVRSDLQEYINKHAEHVERLIRSAFHVLDEPERYALYLSLNKINDRLETISSEITARPSNYINLQDDTLYHHSDPLKFKDKKGMGSAADKAEDHQSHDDKSSTNRIVETIEMQTRVLSETICKFTFAQS